MEERMHALEDALAIVQSAESSQPHPLLSRPLLLDSEETIREEEEEDTKPEEPHTLIEAFGSLHMIDGDHGAAQRFFGPSGGSEVLSNSHYVIKRSRLTFQSRVCYW